MNVYKAEKCAKTCFHWGVKALSGLSPGVAALFAIHGIQDALLRAFERDKRMAKYTNSEKLLLFHLGKPLRMGEIAEALHCLPSNVTALVDQLETKGLVQREPRPEDRRARQLVLTKAGVQVRKNLAAATAEIFSEVTGLKDSEIEELLALLTRRSEPATVPGCSETPE
jgi:DNA-binding MarR family transcriptional regulator